MHLKIEYSMIMHSKISIYKMNTSQLELQVRMVKIYAPEAINAPNVRLVVIAVTSDALL